MFKIFKKKSKITDIDANGSLSSNSDKKSKKSFKESSSSSSKNKENEPIHTYTKQSNAKSLPQGFAENLLFLEMEMENDIIDMENLKSLLELYATAVEYYESIESDKYYIFKNKTQQLLLRSNVSSAMIRQQIIKQSEVLKETKERTPTAAAAAQNPKNFDFISEKLNGLGLPASAVIQQQKEHQLKVQFINAQDSQENAKILLQQHQQEKSFTKNIISGEISNQKNEVLSRLERRRKSKLVGRTPIFDIDGTMSFISPRERIHVIENESNNSNTPITNVLQERSIQDLNNMLNSLVYLDQPELLNSHLYQKQHIQEEAVEEESLDQLAGVIAHRLQQKKPLESRTPEKENRNTSQVNLIEQMYFGENKSKQLWSNSKNRETSPVQVKLSSFDKSDKKQAVINNSWMMATASNSQFYY